MYSEQDIVRAGVVTLLSDYSECVEVVPAWDASDVLLYDALGLSNGNGHDLDHAVKQLPGRVVALARDLEPALAAQAMSRGAVASVSIGANGRELLDVLLAAATGRLGIRPSAHPANAERERALGEDVQLTEREHQVLALDRGRCLQQAGRRRAVPDDQHGQVRHSVHLREDRGDLPVAGGRVGHRPRRPVPHRPLLTGSATA